MTQAAETRIYDVREQFQAEVKPLMMQLKEACERLGIAEERGDIAKEDSRRGKVRHVADQRSDALHLVDLEVMGFRRLAPDSCLPSGGGLRSGSRPRDARRRDPRG